MRGKEKSTTVTFVITLLLLMVIGITFYGCALTIPKSRPNTTEAQANEDLLQCNEKSSALYPIRNEDMNAGKITTKCTLNGNNTTCTSRPDEPSMYDMNARSRWDFNFLCMQSKGYK